MPWGIWQQSLAVDAADTCVGVLWGVSNVTTGLALGVITYLVIMVCRKRAAMANPVLYGLGGLFALMFPLGAVV